MLKIKRDVLIEKCTTSARASSKVDTLDAIRMPKILDIQVMKMLFIVVLSKEKVKNK